MSLTESAEWTVLLSLLVTDWDNSRKIALGAAACCDIDRWFSSRCLPKP